MRCLLQSLHLPSRGLDVFGEFFDLGTSFYDSSGVGDVFGCIDCTPRPPKVPVPSQILGMQSHRAMNSFQHSHAGNTIRTSSRSCFRVCISQPAASTSLVSLGLSTESGVAGWGLPFDIGVCCSFLTPFGMGV